jgi:hypothetical protein
VRVLLPPIPCDDTGFKETGDATEAELFGRPVGVRESPRLGFDSSQEALTWTGHARKGIRLVRLRDN